MTSNRFLLPCSVLIVFSMVLLSTRSHQKSNSLLIVNAQLADGTGSPLRKANVRISQGRIVGIGQLEPEKDEPTLDAKGLVLAPGFIDIHNHSEEGLQSDPLAETQIAQGITTLLVGADGESPWPIISWLRGLQQNPAAVNVGTFAGHATIRERVMGADFKRVATPGEVQQM